MAPPATIESKQINPSLSVAAEFRTLTDGRDLTTVIDLDERPELAVWLTSFVDTFLSEQGKPGARKGVRPPPDGEIREILIDGGVILLSTRPDGGLALRLNGKQSIWLNVKVRLAGKPALHSSFAIYDEPEVVRWLLLRYIDVEAESINDYPLAASDLDNLVEIGVLVDEFPPPGVCFPDPSVTPDSARELATAGECFIQLVGQAVPDEVRRTLGRRTPRLPADTTIVWGRDAGTGLMFPSIAPPDSESGDALAAAGAESARRATEWASRCESAAQSISAKRYAILREIIPAAQRDMLRDYVRQIVARGYFPVLDDGQVELRASLHNEPTIASIHNGLAGLLTRIIGEKMLASYCFLGCYEAGAVLERHTDRPQCAYNLSIVFDMYSPDEEPDPWPIYVEIDGEPVAVNLNIGDGLMYPGTELFHWRNALPANQRAIICFFHFVPEDFQGSLH
jgi:hypothetical protein